MPLLIAGRSRREAEGRATPLLERLGLAQRLPTGRPVFPAASSSGWRSPARSPTGRA